MSSSSDGTEKTYFLNRLWRGIKMVVFFKRRRTYQNSLYIDTIWNSIEEMPIWNWNKIIESGDLTYMYIDQNIKGFYSKRLMDTWMDLQEQHIREFGIDDLLRIRMKKMTKLIKLNIRYVQTRDRSLLNLIEIAEADLNATETHFDMRFHKVLDIVSTSKGFRINPKEYTVIEWYHALKNMAAHGRND